MKPAARHKARRLAVQALYQLVFGEEAIEDVIADRLSEVDPNKTDCEYFKQIVYGVFNQTDELDQAYKPYITRQLKDLTPIERSVLRLATYEMQTSYDVPYRVIINEALQLAKTFGTSEGYKFVNGVLDKLAKKLRSGETQQHTTNQIK